MASLTDNPSYRNLCKLFSKSKKDFNSFRSHPTYNIYVDHVHEGQGQEYLDRIVDPDILPYLDQFKKNDSIGLPHLCVYEGIGHISPSTLRYIYILQDIKKRFLSLDHQTIVEIGIGYGGQCNIICSYFNSIKEYILIDLPETLALAKRYLSGLQSKAPVKFVSSGNVPKMENVDLVISNYSFSEMDRETQQEYVDKVLLQARQGYLICNHITPREFHSFRGEDILEAIPAAKIEPEDPCTGQSNYLVTWGGNG